MGVRTQRRAWMVRAAVVVVAAAASMFGVAAPAFAATLSVNPDNVNLQAGQSRDIAVTVSDVPPAPPNQMIISASLPPEIGNSASIQGVGCNNPCVKTKTGGNITVTFKITASQNLAVGLDVSGLGTVTAREQGSQESDETQFSLAVKGPDQQAPQVVPEVSGTVTDSTTGKGVSAAKVFLQDSGTPPHQYEVGTDKDGKFKFTSEGDGPIAPGTIALRVEREGFAPYDRVVQGQAGVPLKAGKLAMAPNTSATPTSAATAGPSGSTDPTLGEAAPDPTTGNEEETGLSWLLIAIGGLLVVLGIGAIVLLLVRRNRDDDDDDDDGAPAPRRGPPPGRAGPPRPPQPPRRGAPPERTTVMRGGPPPMGPPVSPGPRGADQTMIARSPLADMPTQMHRPLPDPDPYATRQNGAHAAPPYPGPPGQAGGYGPPQYGGPPPPAGYPGGAPGYAPDPQYGQPYPGGGGPAYPGGYEQPTYGQPYGQQPPYDPQPGYDQYDQRGQRPPPPPEGRGRVDWLDD